MTAEHDQLLEWETIAIPFAKGVDLGTTARAVEVPSLLRLENATFDRRIGLTARRGFTPTRVRTPGTLPGAEFTAPEDTADESLPPSGWYYGFGLRDADGDLPATDLTAALIESAYPYVGHLRGVVTRGTEELVWDGARLMSLAPGQTGPVAGVSRSVRAPMPHAQLRTLGGFPGDVDAADLAVGERTTVLAWRSAGVASATLTDSVTGAVLLDRTVLNSSNCTAVRAAVVGGWCHVLEFDSVTADLRLHSIFRNADLPVVTTRLVKAAATANFDLRVVDGNRFLIALRAADGKVLMDYRLANGDSDTGLAGALTEVLVLAGAAGDSVGLGYHPAGVAAVLAQDGTDLRAAWLDTHLQVVDSYVIANGRQAIGRVTCEVRGVTESAGALEVPVIECYWEDEGGGGGPSGTVELHNRRIVVGGGVLNPLDRGDLFRMQLAGQAHRVGNDVFVLAAHDSDVQPTYFLLDAEMKPCGRFRYGTAGLDRTAELPSVHVPAEDLPLGKDQYRFTAALLHRERLTSNLDAQQQFSDRAVTRLELDYLPRLRAAEFGRAAYFAGAMVSTFDGRDLHEANWLLFPEVTGADAASVGTRWDGGAFSLGAGDYQYRVYLFRRTEQGEDVMSAAITTPDISNNDNSIVLTIPHVAATRVDSTGYFKIYRREATGTRYYLVSNPVFGETGCPINDPTGDTTTFTDGLPDSVITDNEEDPYAPTVDGATALANFSPPGCTVIANGRGRIFLAGGEVTEGSVLPSLLPGVRQAVSWNPQLEVTVGPVPDAVTALAEMNQSVMIFRRDRIHALDGSGPSNTAEGDWQEPRLLPGAHGAVGPEGLAHIPTGLVFHSPGGLCLLALNWLVNYIGEPIQPLLDDVIFTGATTHQADRQLRLHRQSGGPLVLDWELGAWGVWNDLPARGAAVSSDRGLLVTRDGRILRESAAGATFDAGRPVRLIARITWLAASHLDSFQRVRRVGWVGDSSAPGDWTVVFRVFYNDGDFPVHEWTWDPAVDLNTTGWGDGTWGSGFWGTATGRAPRNSVARGRKRLRRQKCSRISVEIEVRPTAEGAFFSPTAITLELGRRKGLARIGTRGAGS